MSRREEKGEAGSERKLTGSLREKDSAREVGKKAREETPNEWSC